MRIFWHAIHELWLMLYVSRPALCARRQLAGRALEGAQLQKWDRFQVHPPVQVSHE